MRNYIRKMRSSAAFTEVLFDSVGRRFGTRFFAGICGARKLFVNVAKIRSDAF